MDYLDILRQLSLTYFVVLTCIGTTQYRSVEAQAIRQTTLRPTVGRPPTTIRPTNRLITTTIPGQIVGGTARRTPGAGATGFSPVATVRASPGATPLTPFTPRAVTPSTTPSVVGPSGTTGRGTTRPPRPTENPPRRPRVSTTGYVVTYLLQADENSLDNANRMSLTCPANNIEELAKVLQIAENRLVGECTKYNNQTLKNTVLVTLRISSGDPPNDDQLEDIKTGKTAYRPMGLDEQKLSPITNSFTYSDQIPIGAKISAENLFLGLQDTYWVLIGMGAVIVLLVVISVVVICIGRSGRQGVRPDANVQDGELDTPHRKKRRFPWQRKQRDQDVESNNDESDSDHNESAYGSNPELSNNNSYNKYQNSEAQSRGSSVHNSVRNNNMRDSSIRDSSVRDTSVRDSTVTYNESIRSNQG